MPTTSSNPVHILIASDAWGTRAILTICRDLTSAQFHQRFEIGLGSLHDTLTHMIGAMRFWTDRLAERPVRRSLIARPSHPNPNADARDRTPDELLALLDDAQHDLLAVAAACDLASTLTLDWPAGPPHPPGSSKTYTFSRAAVISHITTHGYHHRAQCLNMLRQFGGNVPVPGVTEGHPELSAVDWQAAVECPAVVRQG